MRVAIYARVSTEDKGQDPENQLRDLRAWCADSGHDLVGEYVDRVSGRKGTGESKQFAALFEIQTAPARHETSTDRIEAVVNRIRGLRLPAPDPGQSN